MRFISTRGLAKPESYKGILLKGLATDGGLYIPEEYPSTSLGFLEQIKKKGANYTNVAQAIHALYVHDIYWENLNRMIAETYTTKVFGEGITPLKWLNPNLALLQLSNGPTLAFKDVPLQLLSVLMDYVLAERGDNINILGATSGDTGSAAEYAFMGKEATNVFMLSPFGRMSRFQQQQMYTLDVPNIHNLVVNGTFDDCQAVVKAVNADAEFKERYKIGAVNSMNLARIIAQVPYYYYAYLHAVEKIGDEVTFVVPTGNYGNTHAAYVAKCMGLPIKKIIVATNENDVLHEFFQTGIYRVRKGDEVKITSSSSMDIAAASNFERFMFDYVGRDPKLLNYIWGLVTSRGTFSARENDPGLLFGISSGSATDAEVLATIRSVHGLCGVVIDPHTAVGVKVALEQAHPWNGKVIVAETAQPAKFADTIRKAIGIEPPTPAGFEKLADLPEHTTRIDPDPEAVKKYIADHVS